MNNKNILALGKQTGDLWVQGQPGLQSWGQPELLTQRKLRWGEGKTGHFFKWPVGLHCSAPEVRFSGLYTDTFGKRTHWTSTVELTHANQSALDPRRCSQGPSGPPPAPSSQSVTAQRLHNECGSSLQSFLTGEDSPVELCTAFSACLTAPH